MLQMCFRCVGVWPYIHFRCPHYSRARAGFDCLLRGDWSVILSTQVVWAVRDAYIGNTFFDASASAFVLPSLPVYSKSDENAPGASTSISSSTPSSDFPSYTPGTQGSPHSDGQEAKAPPTPGCEFPIWPDALRGITPQLDQSSKTRGTEGIGPRKNAPLVVGEHPATTVCGAGLGPHWLKTLNTHRRPTESGASLVRGCGPLPPPPRAPTAMLNFVWFIKPSDSRCCCSLPTSFCAPNVAQTRVSCRNTTLEVLHLSRARVAFLCNINTSWASHILAAREFQHWLLIVYFRWVCSKLLRG